MFDRQNYSKVVLPFLKMNILTKHYNAIIKQILNRHLFSDNQIIYFHVHHIVLNVLHWAGFWKFLKHCIYPI